MLKGPCLVGAQPGQEGEQAKNKLSTLKQKWEALKLEAEERLATFTSNMNWIWHDLLQDKPPTALFVRVSGHFVFGRRANLELILPRAKLFEDGVGSLQQWLMSMEQALGELRNAERVMLHLSEATERAKVGLQCMVQLQEKQTWKILFIYVYILSGSC